MDWLSSKKLPNKLTHDEAVKTLKTFAKAWQPTQDLTRLRNDLASKIAISRKKSILATPRYHLTRTTLPQSQTSRLQRSRYFTVGNH